MRKIIICLAGLLLLWGCEEEELVVSVGDNFISSQTTVSLIDSISVKMSTFKIDSIPASGVSYAMVGSYVDDEFGTVSSSAYLQIDMPIVSIADDEIFDSLVINLPYSGISYGDTLLPQTISIHRVLEDIEPAEDESYLYNSSSFNYDEDEIGSITVKARPHFFDEIELRLSDKIGLELMELLRDDEDEIDGTSDFLEAFKGIVLVPGVENNVLLSFAADTAFKFELHTHIIAEERIENTYSFAFQTNLYHFNNITSDVSGKSLAGLLTQRDELKSAQMDDKAYLQAGTGFVTRVDFPGISKILEEERYNILYKAELVLKPVIGTYNQLSLPENLVLYTTDKYNNLVSEIVDDDGYSIYADFYLDEFYNESNQYRFDVTDFVYEELSDGFVDEDNGLLIMLPNGKFHGTADRVVFDARTNSKYRPVLNLYYVFYE